MLTGTACGTIRLWSSGAGKEVQTGGPLERLRVNGDMVATGGKDNDLKIWSVETGLTSTFKAKNVNLMWPRME